MDLLLNAKATLGEGPSWDETNDRLYWVDIERHQVHVYHPTSGNDETIDVGDYVGAVVPRMSGGLVVALRHGFYHLDPVDKTLALLASCELDMPGNRFNDGKCDALGRFWAGTMHLREKEPSGALYCLDTDSSVRKVLEGVTISNGLGWSPDNTRMYYIDTPTKQVVAFDFDLASGRLSNKRVVVTIDDGWPDGMTVDAEGMLWVAHWGGSKVSRWNPDLGTRIADVELPVSFVTSCVFGGSDLTDLYITTASRDVTEQERLTQSGAGGLFRGKVGAKGQRTYAFGG